MMSGQNFPTETCMPPLRLRPALLAGCKQMNRTQALVSARLHAHNMLYLVEYIRELFY